jgi:hypothetical protein
MIGVAEHLETKVLKLLKVIRCTSRIRKVEQSKKKVISPKKMLELVLRLLKNAVLELLPTKQIKARIFSL